MSYLLFLPHFVGQDDSKNLCAKILYFYTFVSYQMCPSVTRKLKVKEESLISLSPFFLILYYNISREYMVLLKCRLESIAQLQILVKALCIFEGQLT